MGLQSRSKHAKRGKNLCIVGEIRLDAHARAQRRADDLTEPINTKIQTLQGPDFVSQRGPSELH